MITHKIIMMITCDACGKSSKGEVGPYEKTSTVDAILWREVRDITLTSQWFRIQFPDSATFREYHVCGNTCAQLLIEQRYQAEKDTNADMESSKS